MEIVTAIGKTAEEMGEIKLNRDRAAHSPQKLEFGTSQLNFFK